ncbi:MAG: molybdenum cofactor guanylyltransferase [Bacillota bacterium]
MSVTGVVLAGGRSTRMGKNKAFVEIDGLPMIELIIQRLSLCVDDIIIISNDPGALASVGHPVFGDLIPGRGPLGGIQSGLVHAPSTPIFFIACDLPFFSVPLVRYMLELAPRYDVVVPKIGGYFEPTHACYSKSCLPFIEPILKEDAPRIIRLYDQVSVRTITEQDASRFGDLNRMFFNINTPEDLKRARALGVRMQQC